MSIFRPRYRLVLIALCALLVIGEVAGRLAGMPVLPRDPTFVTAREWSFPDWVVKDHDLFWRFRPDRVIDGRYTINRRGYRGRDFAIEKTPGVTRIVCLGESNTFGLGLPDYMIWPVQLEKRLRELDPLKRKWEVLNLAVTDYSTVQGLRLAARELPRLKPDIVLYCFSWADHQRAAKDVTDEKLDPGSPIALEVEGALNHSALVRWSKRFWSWLLPVPPPAPDIPSFEQRRVPSTNYADNIEKIARESITAGARAIMITSPISWPPPGMTDTSAVFDVHHRYRRLARYGAIVGGGEYVDMANFFDKNADFYDDPRREVELFNARGHAAAGDFLARYILGDTAIVDHYGSASAVDKE